MRIYYYQEYNGCTNTGYPVDFGDCESFLKIMLSGAVCVAAKEKANLAGTTLCLGCFDGVHVAHRSLLEHAGKNGHFGVLLFDRNVKNTPMLTTQYEKIELLRDFGADYVLIAEFSDSFRSMPPEKFAEFLAELGIERAVVGYDYRFGNNASGDVNDLADLAKKYGFGLDVIETVSIDGEPIKSTKIREYIENGDIRNANTLLGYAYRITGTVEKGLENGHKLGFPTANISIDPEKLLPPDGVYRGKVFGKDAAVNIGHNPTFDADVRTVEAHLIDYDGDLYGKFASLELFEKIRDDIKFDSLDALRVQIKKDVDFVKGR